MVIITGSGTGTGKVAMILFAGKLEEVAQLALFLVPDVSFFITGQYVNIGGGMIARVL